MIEVRNHFFVIERLLEEEGLDTDSIKVRIKVIESMAAHTRMHAMDSNLISLPWEEFKINMCTPS
jgi:sulfur relay (sulfurtransferase) DsrF/TusC family protein